MASSRTQFLALIADATERLMDCDTQMYDMGREECQDPVQHLIDVLEEAGWV